MRSQPKALECKWDSAKLCLVKTFSKEEQITKNGEDRRKPVPAVFVFRAFFNSCNFTLTGTPGSSPRYLFSEALILDQQIAKSGENG
jgi:hypothetical protein